MAARLDRRDQAEATAINGNTPADTAFVVGIIVLIVILFLLMWLF